MRPDDTIAALAACGAACLQASNGHQVRWALDRCVRAQVAAGAQPGPALQAARAMANVAQHINAVAAQGERQATTPSTSNPRAQAARPAAPPSSAQMTPRPRHRQARPAAPAL